MEFKKEYKEHLENIKNGNYNSVPGNVKGYLIKNKLVKYEIQRESMFNFENDSIYKLTDLGFNYLKGE